MTAPGLKWSVGADIGWRAKAACLITQTGGQPNPVVSGRLVSGFNRLTSQPWQGFTRTPRGVWAKIAPVISFTGRVAPVDFKVVNRENGIAVLTAFVTEMGGDHFAGWAKFEETAQAWAAAGVVPGRMGRDESDLPCAGCRPEFIPYNPLSRQTESIDSTASDLAKSVLEES